MPEARLHRRHGARQRFEQLDPDPFMEGLNQYGLPWQVMELDSFALAD
jgi:saccharopine dehydrogenase-like NADP-dependent oxidoreductase